MKRKRNQRNQTEIIGEGKEEKEEKLGNQIYEATFKSLCLSLNFCMLKEQSLLRSNTAMTPFVCDY